MYHWYRIINKNMFYIILGTIEQVSDVVGDDGAHNATMDILSLALEMASAQISSDIAERFDLVRNFITPGTVFTKANGGYASSCAGLLIMSKCPVAAVVSEMATEMKLFHVLFSEDILSCRLNSRYLVDLTTSEERFIEELQKIVQYGLRWKRVLLLHDFLLQPRGASIFKIALSKASVKFKILPLMDSTETAQLDRIAPLLTNVYETILFLESQILDVFIDVFATSGLLHPRHQWFVLSDTTCREALGKPSIRDSNMVMLKPKHVVNSSDYAKCPGHRLGQDKALLNVSPV
ncbi:hypothetical protein ElyMa_006591700 [Elysia marginata]|uniref:Receptor ligand binding region domain-containing protein n=1 Tax=Elysia marginata TaxID=1093978 RepID=A0AAV4IFN7_9GAST|nr:hypothetical protein ElyMa_006591700 [Elysia marginata]